jgi:hypothetical protein
MECRFGDFLNFKPSTFNKLARAVDKNIMVF